MLERDRERDQQKEAFRRDLIKQVDQVPLFHSFFAVKNSYILQKKLAELREQETAMQRDRMEFENKLREKYDQMQREDQLLIQEERKRLEEYEKEIHKKFQIVS